MTCHLVTFSDSQMSRAQALCIESALRNGCHLHWFYDQSILKQRFTVYSTNPQWIKHRGCGYWLFKPLLVNEVLSQIALGDIVIYSDAGVEFINNVSHIVDRMGHDKPQDDIFLFGNNWEHAHWCKRDVVDSIWPMTQFDRWSGRYDSQVFEHMTWQRFGKQVQASVIFFRVSDYTREFVAEWLKWCLFEGGRLIDDSPSRALNHPEFREHRHDQAILTTLAYREGIKLHYWPAVYNKGGSPEFVYEKLPEYAGDDYPILFHHHRKRNHEWA